MPPKRLRDGSSVSETITITDRQRVEYQPVAGDRTPIPILVVTYGVVDLPREYADETAKMVTDRLDASDDELRMAIHLHRGTCPAIPPRQTS